MLKPDVVTLCLLSFEGPDRYALSGGLGVRVTQLAECLARQGFETHLLFVGDPDAPGTERRVDGRLILHRWCQWISAYHPSGVYDGEEDKRRDFTESVPRFVIEEIIRPALAAGRLPVVLAEEWHTVDAVVALQHGLRQDGLDGRCVVLWNANNTMSFHRIDWKALAASAQLTTVSRYMKHLMWRRGVNPLVIPNGIPASLFEDVDEKQVRKVRACLDRTGEAVVLFKAGRFDPAKRWLMAVEAAAELKALGYEVAFPLTGGIEPHGGEVLRRAYDLGLTIAYVDGAPETWSELVALLRAAPKADVYDLRFYMKPHLLRLFYAAADAVLANSGHEPFGLVGLEAMAAGGIVFTGSTGEEYAVAEQGAIALDTDLPEEIVSSILALKHDPERERALRQEARRQAARFSWEKISTVLLDKIAFVAQRGRMLTRTNTPVPRARTVVVYTVVHQPRRLRLPAQPLGVGTDGEALTRGLFDDALNEAYFRKVARTCYAPAIGAFEALLGDGFKLAIGFSLSFIEQAERWDPALLDAFRRLVRHENVEVVAVEPEHGFVMLWDVETFAERMRVAVDRLHRVFGKRPVVADTTEMTMSDTVYHALDGAGFRGAFMDGRRWVLGWREPTHVYHHDPGRMKLLTRHHDLSDDVGYRFSNRGWSGWPLMADTYASWLSGHPGELIVLGWDFETFGEHHRRESGIFEFLRALPSAVRDVGLTFATPSEALDAYGAGSFDLPLPAFPSTWAGSGGLSFFLGNEAQRAVFQLMMHAWNKARLTGDPELVELALWLAQSDNLHLIQWFGRSGDEAEVSAYFTPKEWWSLGPEGIIWEIQQVYKNFIRALDARLPREALEVTGDGQAVRRRVGNVGR